MNPATFVGLASPPTPNNGKPLLFTIRQLADGLGVSFQAATARLQRAKVASAEIDPKGTQQFRLADLPADLRVDLDARALQSGCRDTAHHLKAARAPFEPNIPFAKWHSNCLKEANRNLLGLASTIARRNDPLYSREALIAAGIEDYFRATGVRLTAPQLWRRLTTALDRARDGNFERIEIYAPGRLYAATPNEPVALEVGYKEFAHYLASLPVGNWNIEQETNFWIHFLDEYNGLVSAGQIARRVKKDLVRLVFSRFPWLATTEAALDKLFRRKLARWQAGGEKPSSLKPKYRGRPRGPEISENILEPLVAHITGTHDGKIAPGYRDFMCGRIPGMKPDQGLLDYYVANPSQKSFVPEKIREAVKSTVESMKTIHLGIYQYEQTAHLLLDDSRMHSGDYWCSDDTTLPVYAYLPDGTLTRGQTLLTVDHKSRRILGVASIPERGYSAINILAHIIETARESGNPRFGMIWERGTWKKARLLKGAADADLVPPNEAELGLREFIKFVHRTSPKGKIVERIIGMIQDRMFAEPGYCGRAEMTQRIESWHRLKMDIESGRVNPAGKIYSFEQWGQRLRDICAEYNDDPQDTLGGLSPNEAYKKFENSDDPLIKLGPEIEYLRATHRRAVTVTDQGICFMAGKVKYLYRNERTGDPQLRNKRALIWFDPCRPEIGYVTDLERRNPFAVPLCNPVPTVDAPREVLADEQQKLRAHQAPVRALYHALKAKYPQSFRRNIVTPEAIAVGHAFKEGAEQIRSEQNIQRRKSRRVRHAEARLGLDSVAGEDFDEQQEGLDMIRQGLAEMNSEKQGIKP